MILLVPTSPEVPRFHRPTWGVSWVLAALLIVSYFQFYPTVEADQQYIDQLQIVKDEELGNDIAAAADVLSRRPLLSLSISPKSWSLERAICSNFIHGGALHLILNLVGVIAGVRICTTFIPFLCTLSIFIIGGTLGLLSSIWITTPGSGDYVPHLGASAGLFALMGTYYVYNFRFRTSYFFWFPSRHGQISLKTSWFFFVDVILLELLLSTSQFLPNTFDGVDHIAHVGGFLSGCLLAVGLRTLQRWPSMLQTRGEFLYWTNFLGEKLKSSGFNPVQASFVGWVELLKINFFNDQLKLKLARHLAVHIDAFSEEQVKAATRFFGPTFIRLFPGEVAGVVHAITQSNQPLPLDWLKRIPYDNIIRIAQALASSKETEGGILVLMASYQKAHQSNKNLNQRLEALIQKMQEATPNRSLASGE
ncbi:MAG: rhomboid family intramembrane serine protease [Pseudomonadota bacterium]